MKKKPYIVYGVLILMISFLVSCVGGGLKQANVKLNAQKFDDAIQLYKEFLAENPDDAEARSRLGFAYLKTGRLDEATTEFQKALTLEPGEPFSVLYLGQAYLNKGQIGKTIKTWQGFRDKSQPLVEDEIKRQLTLLQIAESQRLAKKAIGEEQKLVAIEPKANTIAVSYFKDLSPDKSLGPFQKGLAAMVTTDLSKIKSLKVIERVRLQALIEEMKMGQTGIVDEQTAPRLGRLLGAKNFVVGSIREGSIEVAASVNQMTGSVAVELNEFWKIPRGVIQIAINALQIKLSPEEKRAIGKVHTKNYKAFIYYGKALMAKDAGNWKEAKDLFVRALKEDPLFGLAKEGADASPGATAPTTSTLSTMTSTQLSSTTNSALSAAQAAQGAASDQAGSVSPGSSSGSSSSGDEGGGGGGGGGG